VKRITILCCILLYSFLTKIFRKISTIVWMLLTTELFDPIEGLCQMYGYSYSYSTDKYDFLGFTSLTFTLQDAVLQLCAWQRPCVQCRVLSIHMNFVRRQLFQKFSCLLTHNMNLAFRTWLLADKGRRRATHPRTIEAYRVMMCNAQALAY